MKRSWWYRFTLLLILIGLSIFVILPTAMKFDDGTNYPFKSKINLGLDLQGGLYMVLGIDFNKVYKDEVLNYVRKMEFLLKDKEIEATVSGVDISTPDDPMASIVLKDPSRREEAETIIKEYYRSVVRLTSSEGVTLTYALAPALKKDVEKNSVTKSIEVIRNRIDEFGVTEPEIISQGHDRIIVQLPGVKDIERAKELIGKTAKLEFRIVNDQVSPTAMTEWMKKVEDAKIIYKNGEKFSAYVNKVNELLKADLPAGYEIAYQKVIGKLSNEVESKVPYLVDATPRLTGDDLQDASVQINQQKNEPYVSMTFKSAGAKRFETVTEENKGKRMAVMLDGNVYTAPTIQARISGGSAQITLGAGDYNKLMQEARDIALVLRAGALPVELDFLEQRIIGPSLGDDSIQKGKFSAALACLLVFVLVILYYRISGFIATLTLGLNVLFLVAGLVLMGATLTLPGIAGIALTVGMAVDANIIIYERIREEIRRGVGNFKAVEAGFEHAFWTIIDANLTTAFAGIALLNFGTGPIRGFAVTLLLGIATTVYTAYFVSRICFDFYMNKVEGQDLSI